MATETKNNTPKIVRYFVKHRFFFFDWVNFFHEMHTHTRRDTVPKRNSCNQLHYFFH